MKAVKVLQVCSGEDKPNGVESFLINYNKLLAHEVSITMLFCSGNQNRVRIEKALGNSVTIVEPNALPNNNKSIIGFIKLYIHLKKWLKKNKYDVIHVNTGSRGIHLACLFASRRLIENRLIHAHNTEPKKPNTRLGVLKWRLKSATLPLFRKIVIKNATGLLACSNAAGKYMFGDDAIKRSNYHVIRNAIEVEKYIYNSEVRERIRTKEKIGRDAIIMGHIGRLSEQKNPFFLIDIFCYFQKKVPNSYLWMVGDGELREAILEKIDEYSLNNNVWLLGNRNDVPELLQAFDVFVFPSLYEGLSLVMIEAQANGLKIYASDSISNEHRITNSVVFLPLERGAAYWADFIAKEKDSLYRDDNEKEVVSAGYNLRNAVNDLKKLYCD